MVDGWPLAGTVRSVTPAGQCSRCGHIGAHRSPIVGLPTGPCECGSVTAVKLVALLAATTCIACSSPHNGTPDAAISDTAVPPSRARFAAGWRPCPPSSADVDGDCVADASDVCPNIADPAQIDLDGDGIGWMCDPPRRSRSPVEARKPGIRADLRGDTFAMLVTSSPGGYAVVAISPLAKLVIPFLSTNPVDMWTLDINLSGPVIDDEGYIWWSHGQFALRRVRCLDPVAGTITKKQDGTFSEGGATYAGGKLGLLRLFRYIDPSVGLFSTQHGALVRIDMPPVGDVRPLPRPRNQHSSIQRRPPSPASWRCANTSSAIPPRPICCSARSPSTTSTKPSSIPPAHSTMRPGQIVGELSELPFCIRQGSSVRYVGVKASDIIAGPLPFSSQTSSTYHSCPFSTSSASLAGHTLSLTNRSYDLNGDNIVTIRDGIVTLSVSSTNGGDSYKLDGDQLPILDGPNQYVVAPKLTASRSRPVSARGR